MRATAGLSFWGPPTALRLALLVFSVVVGCQSAIPVPSGPPTSADLRPPKVPVIVSTPRIAPMGPAQQVVGVPAIVSAHALGEAGIATLELWDGTVLAASAASDPGSSSPAFYERWVWTPDVAGEHVLFVRAVDREGRGVQSPALRVNVLDQPAAILPPVPTRGQFAALGSWSPADTSPTQAIYAITPPTVQATLTDCQLTLAVSGAPSEATGVGVYGLAPFTGSFAPILAGPVALTNDVNVSLAGGGAYLFTATVFNDQAEAFSAPVNVTAPADCNDGADAWTGDLSIANGRLVTAQTVDRAYLYVSEGDGAAVRAPSSMGEFVAAGADGSLDFGSLLPPIGSSPLTIEGWGWKGETLVPLGKGTFTPPPPTAGGPGGAGGLVFGGGFSVGGSPLLPGPGVFTKLWVLEKVATTGSASPGECSSEFCQIDKQSLTATIERPKPTDTKPIERFFEWSTIQPNVTQIVWQVFTYPPPASADLNPPFVVDQGVVSVPAGKSDGTFSIDFAKYLAKGVPSVTLEMPGNQQIGVNPIFAIPGVTPTAAPSPAGGSGGSLELANLPNLAAFGDEFYVRIVPLALNTAAMPSNHVTLQLVEPGGGISIALPSTGEGSNQNAYTISWTFKPPIAANPKYARCATVIGFTSDYVAMPVWDQKFKASLQNGTPICYEPPSDDGWSLFDAFDAFVEFVADVWDYMADGVKWIKKQVVSLMLQAVPCQAIASASTCDTIASLAVDMAIVALTGMPPSLPNFDAAMAGLKGDLATLIVEGASSIPGVATACGIADAANTVTSKLKSCEELAAEAVDAVIDEMLVAASDAAGASTGHAWPGVKWKADPRGLYHPPEFEMTITRTADPGLPKTCTVSASMESLVKGWKFPELYQGVVKTTTADIQGAPLLAESFILAPLKAGESVKRTVWLVHPRLKWFESSRAEMYWNYAKNMLNVPDFTRAWALLTHGAELTFHVASNCAKPSQQGPHIMTEFGWGEG